MKKTAFHSTTCPAKNFSGWAQVSMCTCEHEESCLLWGGVLTDATPDDCDCWKGQASEIPR